MQVVSGNQFDIKALLGSALIYSGELQGTVVAPTLMLQLDQLSAQIARRCLPLTSAVARRTEFHRFFYQELGFGFNQENCLASDNGLLDRVWETRSGVGLSIAMLYLYLAQHCELMSFPVAFPGHFLIGIEDDDSTRYLDPANGERMPKSVLSGILRGNKGNLARLSKRDLAPSSEQQVMIRLLSGLKAAFIREEQHERALQCCDWLLQLEPENPFEIRDRGFLLQQLECYPLAAKDLAFFLDKCPKDKSVPLIKLQLKSLQQQSITLH